MIGFILFTRVGHSCHAPLSLATKGTIQMQLKCNVKFTLLLSLKFIFERGSFRLMVLFIIAPTYNSKISFKGKMCHLVRNQLKYLFKRKIHVCVQC